MRRPKEWAPVSLLAMALLTGCGMSPIERQTMAGGLMHQIAAESKAIIDAQARAVSDAAVSPCVDGDTPAEECDAALTEALEPWHQIDAMQHVYASGVDSYILAVVVAAAQDDPDWGDAMRILAQTLAVYRDIVALCAEYGVELPSIGGVMRVIGGDL